MVLQGLWLVLIKKKGRGEDPAPLGKASVNRGCQWDDKSPKTSNPSQSGGVWARTGTQTSLSTWGGACAVPLTDGGDVGPVLQPETGSAPRAVWTGLPVKCRGAQLLASTATATTCQQKLFQGPGEASVIASIISYIFQSIFAHLGSTKKSNSYKMSTRFSGFASRAS